MSKLAHSNQPTMDEIERIFREAEERGERDEPADNYAALKSAFDALPLREKQARWKEQEIARLRYELAGLGGVHSHLHSSYQRDIDALTQEAEALRFPMAEAAE